MKNSSFDVLVIGAGAAGMVAAWEVALTGRTVAVVEAKERAGGRMLTVEEAGVAMELGAEFVHGNLPVTKSLLEKAGAEIIPVEGSIWQYRDGRLSEQEEFIQDEDFLQKKFKQLNEDKPVAAFLQEDLPGPEYETLRFSLKNYVQGYYAADTAKSSTKALCEELKKGEEEQYRVKGGYRLLVEYLEQQCRKEGVQFFFSQAVQQLHWKNGKVSAVCQEHSFSSSKALITVPLGVLQREGITFFPALPDVIKTARQLGFGHVIKLVLRFTDPFWHDKSLTNGQDLSDLNFLFSSEAIPTWWSHHPEDDCMLIGWLGGPPAQALELATKDEIVEKGLGALGRFFNFDVVHLQQKLISAQYYNWSADPHFNGAYSYEVVGGEELMKVMLQPVANTLFFAGEGLHHGPQIGTVEAALVSGRDAAHRLTASFTE